MQRDFLPSRNSKTQKLEAASITQPADPLSFAPPCREIQYVSSPLMNLGYQPLPPATPLLMHVRETAIKAPHPPKE